MNKSTTYSLSLSVILLLISVGTALLLAPHLFARISLLLADWYAVALAVFLYAFAQFYLASIVLKYKKNWQTLITAGAMIILSVVGYRAWQGQLYAETAWLACVFVAIALASRFKINVFDWLQTATLLANVMIGAGLLIRPDWAVANLPALSYEPMRLSLAMGFLVSALVAVVAGLYAEYSRKEQWHLLSIPWMLWAFLAGLAGHLFQVIFSASIIIGLLSSEVVPWHRVILQEGRGIGRRFFYIISGGQAISLFLILGLLLSAQRFFPTARQEIEGLREVGLVSFFVVAVFGLFLVIVVNLSINGLFSGLSGENGFPKTGEDTGGMFASLRQFVIEPFRHSQDLLSKTAIQQKEHEKLLSKLAASEKRRMAQLNLLHQINLELETVLDPPVSAQLTTNAVQSILGGTICAVLEFDPERNDLGVLAASGPNAHHIPPGYRQSIHAGLIGRAARLRRTQLVTDTRLDPDYIALENVTTLSELIVPILFYNQLKGCLAIAHDSLHAFDDSDIRTLEAVAQRLVSSWQRSDHDQRLTRLIQAGVSLSTTLEVEAVIAQVAEIAQQTLDARFVFVALVDKGGGFTRVAQAGYAPTLSSMLNSDPEGNSLIQNILNQSKPIRLRDVRKRFSAIPTGHSSLRSMLALPIRLRQSNIGVLLAFGKFGTNAFNENDEALGNLLASQAAAAVETTWLYQELRSMLNTTTLLYQLSTRIIQSEQLTDAAAAIAETSYQLIQAQAAGVALLNLQGEVEARVQIDNSGLHPGARHPMSLIKQTIQRGQNIIVSAENEMTRVCVPLQTPRHQYGALWVEVSERSWSNARYSSNLQTLANQAAIALERNILLSETRQQAEQLELAYHQLENTYDQTLAALSSALDARDHETEGHSIRVARLNIMLGEFIGLDAEQLKILERGAILHDIGKIGISDSILLKPGPLSDEEWTTMRQHPDIGARIIEGIPFLQDTLPIIRYHQERWNGSGYPMGLLGPEIPLMARIFAVVDAYDALTTDRPYRNKVSSKEAIEYLHQEAGRLFDPDIVEALEQLLKSGGEKG